MLKWKKFLRVEFLILTAVMLLAMAGVAFALYADYNRPNPTMDYVPQELAIYDTIYYEHLEHNCRKCHGSSTADRHHNTPIVVRDNLCIPCHTPCTPGTPDCPNGILLVRDCLTSGCHSWDDVRFGNQRWHHNTDMAQSENCIACHDPNMIEEISPFRDHQTYPPSVVTPTPFSCENCHWEQKVTNKNVINDGLADPDDPGHPSTYDHYDLWGNCVGFTEYPKPILGNFDTHHMDFYGFVVNQCYKCHSQDPSNPDWDPTNPELIRYCMICHSTRTLHNNLNGPWPHVEKHPGWAPVGFHTGGTCSVTITQPCVTNADCPVGETCSGVITNTADLAPTTYRTWDGDPCNPPLNGPAIYTPQVKPGYTADQQCFGCHGDAVPPWINPGTCGNPWILQTDNVADRLFGISPTHGSCGVIVAIRGGCFGDEHIAGRKVEIRPTDNSAPWQSVPIHAWTDTRIEWELPCWTFAYDKNYKVHVVTEEGSSNTRIFTVEDTPTLLDADGATTGTASGPCGDWINLTGHGGFDTYQSKVYADGYHGVYHAVDFVNSAGIYTATIYGKLGAHAWTDTSIWVRLYDLFQDQIDECGVAWCTPDNQHLRNFVRDVGPEGHCNSHPDVWCTTDADCSTWPGEWCNKGTPEEVVCDNPAPEFDECPLEPIIPRCDCLALGNFQIYVKAIYFGDEDASGGLSCGDTIFEIEKSDPALFELTNTPIIYKLNPRKIERGQLLRIYGYNFGPYQSDGQVRIGSKAQALNPALGQGKVLSPPTVLWSNALIKVRILKSVVPLLWQGQTKYVWVEKGGMKSNYLPLKILAPLP